MRKVVWSDHVFIDSLARTQVTRLLSLVSGAHEATSCRSCCVSPAISRLFLDALASRPGHRPHRRGPSRPRAPREPHRRECFLIQGATIFRPFIDLTDSLIRKPWTETKNDINSEVVRGHLGRVDTVVDPEFFLVEKFDSLENSALFRKSPVSKVFAAARGREVLREEVLRCVVVSSVKAEKEVSGFRPGPSQPR